MKIPSKLYPDYGVPVMATTITGETGVWMHGQYGWYPSGQWGINEFPHDHIAEWQAFHPRLVRLEVAMISTRRYTKVVEISEEDANGVCGMIYNNGWSEEECATYIHNADGAITGDEISHVIDTIDVLNHPDGEGWEFPMPNVQTHPTT